MGNTVLTQERANSITEFLNADPNRAKELFELGAKDAATRINSFGHDFSEEEIVDYGVALLEAKKLSDSTLEGVAGGANGGNLGEDVAPVVVVVAAPKVAAGAKIAASAVSGAVGAATGAVAGWLFGRN